MALALAAGNLWKLEDEVRAQPGSTDSERTREDSEHYAWQHNRNVAEWFHVDQDWHEAPGCDAFQGQ